MNRERLQVWTLRAAGLTEILAFVAVVMPRSWMEASHRWLGMGEMPDAPVLMFLIRQASFVYGMHGLLLLLLSTNVGRFRPLVIFTGASYLLSAPVLFAIDYTTGMPLWWTLSDSLGCGLIGALLLLTDGGGGRRG
jgi:hypothetical protein